LIGPRTPRKRTEDARIKCLCRLSMSVGVIPEKMRETAKRMRARGGL
jgi:hypothetical protein